MSSSNYELVVHQDLYPASNPMLSAVEIAREKGFQTLTYYDAEIAASALGIQTDGVITNLADYDPNAPQLSEKVLSMIAIAHDLGKPIAFVTEHPAAKKLYLPEQGDILVPWETRPNIDIDMVPWLGQISVKAQA